MQQQNSLPQRSVVGLVGALLYGAAFAYFGHTTLYALAEDIPTYEALWARLGFEYTMYGVLMIVGGLLFAWSMRSGTTVRNAGLIGMGYATLRGR